jgi:hypothetical protein
VKFVDICCGEREMMGAAKRKMREDLEARERAGAAEMGGAGIKQLDTLLDTSATHFRGACPLPRF